MFHESWGKHRSFDDSFLLQTRKYFVYKYVLVFLNVNLMVLFPNRLNLCNLSSFQKTIMAVNNRGSNLAKTKRFR